MSRTRRLLVLAAAWAIPVVWVAVAMSAGPSDGTTISRPGFEVGSWGGEPAVARAYGDTPLREGDVILLIDGRTMEDWLADGAEVPRDTGEVVTYEVQRQAPNLDRIVRLDVALTRYPLLAALSENLTLVTAAVMLLLAGSLVFWVRPDSAAARGSLAAASLLPLAFTSYPCGPAAIDLAGGRGAWPQLVGEVGCALGIGFLLVAALAFPTTPHWLERRRWAYAVAFAVPALGYAVWFAAVVQPQESPADRLQALATVVAPALVATVPALVVLLLWRYLRTPDVEDRVALRLVLLALAGGVGVWLLLGNVPDRLAGEPLLPSDALILLIVPGLLACLVAAVLRYRVTEVESTLRRALVQALVAILIGGAFLVVISAVNLASDRSFESMVAGGAVALLLLPLAIALQRAVRRLVYGARESPARLVSELRQLDPDTGPEEALRETLALLARRLRLARASVEVFGALDHDRLEVSVGEASGIPTTVDLVVGGVPLGQLRLEVDPGRDPFGRSDRRLLEDVGTQVGALAQAVVISRQLQRSRQQLVSGREEERRRIRRDLHDGLGPSLATLAMGLEATRDLIADDPAQAVDLVDRLSERIRNDIDEVRRLVDGLRPPALDQFGLVSALRQRATEHNLTARATRSGTGMAWTLEADEDVEPLPAAVEVAAYRIVVEAVNNAVRHSAADNCVVTLTREPDALLVRIQDSGVGVAETPRMGVGLSSMRERAEELGGTCAVYSTAGAGTVIEARLPLDLTEPTGAS